MGVSVERNGPVTTVILDAPEVRNAVDRRDGAGARRRVPRLRRRRRRARSACCGAPAARSAPAPTSRRVGPTGGGNRVAPDGDGPMGPSRMLLSKPVIAAVAGHAVAGGLELALWCDLRVVEEDAVLGVFCRRWGVPLIDGGTVRLPRIVGLGPRARPDPHRAAGRRRRGARDRPRQPRRPDGDRARGGRGARRASWRASRSCACATTACPRTSSRTSPLDEALANELRHGLVALEHEALDGAAPLRRGAGRHGTF